MQPNDTAFTFVDYEQDWEGVGKHLTWSQAYRQTLNVAAELGRCATSGDRAVILAPQGLEYVAAFLGALQAGLIAVPLSAPVGGAHDERVQSVLQDTSPSVILTTSSVAGDVAGYVRSRGDESAPSVIEIDSLDLDSRATPGRNRERTATAYLQYTSGSTRRPAGVMISHKNLMANFRQITADYFLEYGGMAPPHTTTVSWLPFYHDLGLILGICAPILAGVRSVFTSPVAFLQRPARWMQLLASNSHVFSAAPNFAFDLAVRKTSKEDMAGLDLGDVRIIQSGAERVQPATVRRFTDRFAEFNLRDSVVRPSYGLAEATVYVATRAPAEPPKAVHFQADKLTAGHAKRCASDSGTQLVSYGFPRSQTIRIVDSDTGIECPPGTVGEIWVHGENVAAGYWERPEETEKTFGGRLVDPSEGTPQEPWLRSGDSGFIFDGELFIIGRMKDLLIVYGRNHSPDDIEATVQEITPGRCAAIAVPDEGTEKLVVVLEFKKRDADDESNNKLVAVKREVTSAISNSHGLAVADLVLVAPGSIPITTSGKIRRATCVEQYTQEQFVRLDA